MNEAVNFAPSDWEEYGRDCVERYREYRKMPVFSHDELLITAALHDSSIKTAKWLTAAMDILVERELESRKSIREKFDMEETFIEEDLPSDEYYQCSVCKAYIFLSQITCACTTNAVCGEHVAELCDCDIATRVYRLWWSDQDLVDLATKISERAKVPEIWSQKYKALTEEYECPPLKNLRTLLAEAERIQYPLPELATLKAFVEHANEWVEEATAFVARKHQNRRKNERVWRAGSKVQELEERDRIQRNPEYVYKLLDEASRLAFEAPEIDALREKLEAIEEFQERGEKALNDGTLNSLEEYSELIDEGKSLNVDLPVLDRLERITDQLRWVEKATDVTDVYLTLNEVLELMDEGERAGISVDHELMRQLASRRDRGRWWEEAASRLLTLESIPLQALVSLLDSATDLSIHKETYDKAESIILKAREVNQHMESLLARITSPEKPPLSEALRVLKVMNELPIKSSESVNFRKLVGKAEDWVKHGKRLFGKMNASIHQLEDHLLYVQNRNERVFDVADVPRRDDEAQDSESGPYCICRSGPTGQMVECDICKEW
jgi:[histone H3]-trimethyl-L-lysine4 demethylase